MTTGFELIALAGLAALVVAFGLAFLRSGTRGRKRPAGPETDDQRVFIPMPEALKTRDEIVAWMIGDMPRIVEELAREKS